MTSQLIYNNDDLQDVIYILQFIDSYTYIMGIFEVEIDLNTIDRIVKSCKQDFPHKDGIKVASAFKLVANFVCHFVAERPIVKPFPSAVIGNEMAKIENHQNAMLAFAIAEESLNKSVILRKDERKDITVPIHYSRHSYGDIIEALSNISPSVHFKLVTVLFEQLVYKSNPDCQYKTS